VVASVSLAATLSHAKGKKQPNLLFIFPDQMRREAMGFWQKGRFRNALRTKSDPVVTPTLDKLAGESIVFTQAVSTCPVCSPYRAMLMSGMYPWQNGVVNNCHETRKDGLRHDIEGFTDVLAGAGYDTCYVGKTHWERNDPLFDENQNYVGTTEAPGGHRFNPYDTYIPPGRGRHGNCYWFQCVKDSHKDPRVYSNRPERIDGKADGVQHRPEIYSPKLEADVLVDFLKNNVGQRDTSNPFSIIWAPNPPHNPYDSEKDCDEIAYREFYKGKEGLLNRPNGTGENKELAEKRVPFYFANVTGVDKQLGRVFQALEESGEADNTIVIFTADHGEMMGSHNKFGKLVIYEEAFCVPFMIKVPGRTKGTLEDLMISPVDFMPTVLGMMGLKARIPATVEGRNYSRELITGDWSSQPKPRSALFLGYNNKFKGVRTDRYTFQIDDEGKQLLFDNEKDPYQMKGIALSDIPKADADFILSELGNWLEKSNDPWYHERKFDDLIQYPA
jgi:arylsulfatase A-like enzyme